MLLNVDVQDLGAISPIAFSVLSSMRVATAASFVANASVVVGATTRVDGVLSPAVAVGVGAAAVDITAFVVAVVVASFASRPLFLATGLNTDPYFESSTQ